MDIENNIKNFASKISSYKKFGYIIIILIILVSITCIALNISLDNIGTSKRFIGLA